MSKFSEKFSNKLSLGIILQAVPIFILTLELFFLQSRYLIKKRRYHAPAVSSTQPSSR